MKKYSEALENVKTKLEVMKYKKEDVQLAMYYSYIDFTTTDELMRVKMQIERNAYILDLYLSAVVNHKNNIDVLTKSIELLRLEEERLEEEQ